MDGDRFDDITRALATGLPRATSRRKLLAGLAGGALAAAFGRRPADIAAVCPPGAIAASGGRYICKNTGKPPVNGTCTGAGSPGGGCGAGQTLCGTTCVDTSSDLNHCGACGRPCGGTNATGALCRASQCFVTACAPGFADCNGTGFYGCETQLGTNANCGGCGQACTGVNTCGGGTPGVCGNCKPADPATACAGKCGTVPDGYGHEIACSGCGGGLTCCNGTCVNLSTDVDNCRECGRVCESDPAICLSATCQGGNCVFTAVVNCCQRDDQSADANPCTVSTCDPHTLTCRHDPDPNADNTACGTGKAYCAGACIDVSSDAANCGTCGNTCTENQPCGPCPSGQLCPDRGPGCCESGMCAAGRCTSKALPVCGSCASPLCDPDLGSICVSHCPPPDACHTGDGICQPNGSCTYAPKCGLCGTCDPASGTCTPKACGPCETCDPDTGQCVTTCTNPPDGCHPAPGTCSNGVCTYSLKDCGPCSGCLTDFQHPDQPGICSPIPRLEGQSCGTCHVCHGGTCQADVGASCGTCQVCNEHGTCEFGADGSGCGTCRVCSGGVCGFAAKDTPCGADGHFCDDAGHCLCKMICGTVNGAEQCCPGASVACCVSAEPSLPPNAVRWHAPSSRPAAPSARAEPLIGTDAATMRHEVGSLPTSWS